MDETGVPVLGLLVVIALAAAFYVWVSLANAAMFRKLGEEGWKAWVPVYNTFVIFQLGGVNVLWAITLFIPGLSIVGFVFSVIAINSINKRFEKGVGFTILGVLAEPIWASILGWSSARAVHDTASTVGGPELQGAPTAVSVATPDGAVPSSWPAQTPASTGGVSAGVGAIGLVPAEIPGRMPVVGNDAFDASVPAANLLPAVAAPLAVEPVETAGESAPLAHSGDAPAGAPAQASGEVPAEVPADVLPATGPVEEPVEPSFSYTPAVIASPAWSAPAAPIEMPEEISVRVSPVHTPVVRPAQPLIDAVPAFGAPTPIPAPSTASFVAASAAPTAAPQSAASARVQPAASAQAQGQAGNAETADIDDDMDATIIAARRNKAWMLETDAGQRVPLTAAVVLLGRNPSADEGFPNAQLVTVRDAGRTISKTHARVELVDNEWIITDLNSTNGVYLVNADGEEVELESEVAASVGARFVLGEVAARIFQEE